jgi:hypothetical protein
VGSDLRHDGLPDAVHVSENLIVPKSQDRVTLIADDCITPRIVRACFCVLAAVNFNDEQ